ncbi:protein FAR-RED IMPAIRED RESPONSE 1-like [Humulus lupulus]|uniref:protein FAR-RED IMPAIRED RESPONSE 1-like n=1 Tax=Humulus lupulus TaxID=3486 RepID=UPI002B404C47|nr:protein FAR-RED IMPAIRED RESPONSE 1-like [Humulus lupulus]
MAFRVNLVKTTSKWVCKEFIADHSHWLTFKLHKQFLQSNRVVSDGYTNQVKSLKETGVRTCHIMSYMANQVGGYHKITFTMKDMYNRMPAVSTVDFAASDVGRALGNLEHKMDMDPDFFGIFSYDNSNRLLNLFWADGKARLDYETYGHSISFDSTYKTNSYGKPLLICVGVNNHFKTCPFGYAILDNDSTSSYMWAIKAFLECMHRVAPKTVVTDGDLAMETSIEALMLNEVHRLCYLHLHNKAILKGKDCTFAQRLSDLCFTYYEEEVFDHKLNELITEHELDGTDYAAKLWATKHKWGETFLRGNFFVG